MARKLNVVIHDFAEEAFDQIGDLIKQEPIGAELAEKLGLPVDWMAGVDEGGNARLRVEISLVAASRLSRSELLSIAHGLLTARHNG